ncbi:PEP-CTERM sorting domain-containing protein [Teredinibacter haidensis]|uniref:PEP-CTERM sorting domain-containing protein n=1 Tax=Teredinibacter haidensis TaxID=2731755 RepID=UPI000948AEF2|nr:PEP-CTERM sorting domain-containing protein [Teredinibacter haidensis]
MTIVIGHFLRSLIVLAALLTLSSGVNSMVVKKDTLQNGWGYPVHVFLSAVVYQPLMGDRTDVRVKKISAAASTVDVCGLLDFYCDDRVPSINFLSNFELWPIVSVDIRHGFGSMFAVSIMISGRYSFGQTVDVQKDTIENGVQENTVLASESDLVDVPEPSTLLLLLSGVLVLIGLRKIK